MVFTDLDGTLLDHDTYDWTSAMPALARCKTNNVPVILLSSKTRAEMEILHKRLGLTDPFVSENGGAIFFPMDRFKHAPEGATAVAPYDVPKDRMGSALSKKAAWWALPLGVSYPRLVEALREIRQALGYPLKGFSDMGVEEIAALTGLNKDTARLAQLREYDEPFMVTGNQPIVLSHLLRAAEKKGLRVTSGGRFYHLQGLNDKGVAMSRILSLYSAQYGVIQSVALGDSQNDVSMLQQADFPVLVKSKHGLTSLADHIPGLICTQKTGPAGWNSAVLSVLRKNEEVIT